MARSAVSCSREVSGTDQFTAVADNSTTLQYGFMPKGNQLINANLHYSRMESGRERFLYRLYQLRQRQVAARAAHHRPLHQQRNRPDSLRVVDRQRAVRPL
ncbi:MAG: hypothetical protein OXD01_02965 [Gammaproteobacteria bacterium]|nr:hypothetical protein [Gammaproteobacteria bacterium]